MGEVYRARDTKLDRDVAIKALPASLAGDPERVARFQREAKTLAALNHPNIAAIYGVWCDKSAEVSEWYCQVDEKLADRPRSVRTLRRPFLQRGGPGSPTS